MYNISRSISVIGIKIFQITPINTSVLYLGTIPRIVNNIIIKIQIINNWKNSDIFKYYIVIR